MVSNDIDWSFRTFEIVSPKDKHLKNCKEFLVMSVIVQLRGAQHMRVESNRVDFTIRGDCRENHSNSIVRGVGFDYEWGSRDVM